MTETYSASCPRCSAGLTAVVQGPDSAPWLCRPCRRGWWAVELTAGSRAIYRKERDDFRPALATRIAVEQEGALARARGTSMREDQVALVPAATLRAIAAGRISQNLAAVIAAHLKGT